mgnify:CR=1 FL=1
MVERTKVWVITFGSCEVEPNYAFVVHEEPLKVDGWPMGPDRWYVTGIVPREQGAALDALWKSQTCRMRCDGGTFEGVGFLVHKKPVYDVLDWRRQGWEFRILLSGNVVYTPLAAP